MNHTGVIKPPEFVTHPRPLSFAKAMFASAVDVLYMGRIEGLIESIMGLQEALPALLDLPGQGVGPSTPWNPPAGTKVPDPLHAWDNGTSPSLAPRR